MKRNKGITLIILVITIIMLIITGTAIGITTNSLKTKDLSNMYTDIKSLDDKISVYYNKYGTIPIGEKYTGSSNFTVDANVNDDSEEYYVIDINKLNNLVLTKKLTWSGEDVYIINSKTHTIYYAKGVTLDDETYYRLPGEYSKINFPIGIEEIANDTSYYGAYVNYEPNVETDVKWRIFYVSTPDDEIEGDTKGHIYLIADNYVEIENLPAKDGKSLNADVKDRAVNLYNVYTQYNGPEDITEARLQKLNRSFYEKYTNTTSSITWRYEMCIIYDGYKYMEYKF